MLKESNVRKGFFEREQLDSVLKHLREHNKGPAVFGYITGWRKSEILNLQWRQVDFNVDTVCLDPGTTKNDEGRIFSFRYIPELRTVLENQKAKADALKEKGLGEYLNPKQKADQTGIHNNKTSMVGLPKLA